MCNYTKKTVTVQPVGNNVNTYNASNGDVIYLCGCLPERKLLNLGLLLQKRVFLGGSTTKPQLLQNILNIIFCVFVVD